MKAELLRLRAEVASDRRAFESRVKEIQTIELGSAPSLAQAAVALHHAYGAIEALLARVARIIEGSVPDGADWHQRLLATMGLDIEGIRPALLSAASMQHLTELLAFRHFFRHAYAVSLDPARLERLRSTMRTLSPELGRDLERLDAWLKELADKAT